VRVKRMEHIADLIFLIAAALFSGLCLLGALTGQAR